MRTIFIYFLVAVFFSGWLYFLSPAVRIRKNRTLRRIFLHCLLFIFLQAIVVAVTVAVTQLDDQSYYAGSIRILLDETITALESNEVDFIDRLKVFRARQRLTYESRDNLLENVRQFRYEGEQIRKQISHE